MAGKLEKSKQAVSTKQLKPDALKESANGTKIGFPVVGIGASAGGLDAFKRFFNTMPADSGMAFVLVQHLDPTHESMMTELLSKYTSMQVVQIKNATRLQPNMVFMIPPNKYVYIKDGYLYLRAPTERRGMRLPIDYLFQSMAEQFGERAICIVLSGTGADGSIGLRAIKSGGGTALVQDPKSAQYNGMPNNAIATELVDFVLPVEKMPDALLSYVNHTLMYENTNNEKELAHDQESKINDVQSILAILKARTNHDFRCYKIGTLTRRIQRRMGLAQMESYQAYLEFLRENDQEAHMLLRDLLIGVTAFFRDPEAWDVLEAKALEKLLLSKQSNEPIRIWIPGCSTGEEAYSMAMMIAEIQEKNNSSFAVQIFASDIDNIALEKARNGLYAETIIADITPERLQKYFVNENGWYRTNKRIRDTVVFALQNLISDPPFSKIDLISCRNLLIYLDANIQKRVIALFHFALSEKGYLFLGPSESISQEPSYFEVVDKKWRLFKKINSVDNQRVKSEFPVMYMDGDRRINNKLRRISDGSTRLGSVQSVAYEVLIEEYAPASVILNREGEAIYYYGPVADYLQIASGEPTRHVPDMTRDGLRIKVRSALQRCIRENAIISTTGHLRGTVNGTSVKVTARPLNKPKLAEGLILLTFEDVSDSTSIHPSSEFVVSTDQSLEDLKQLEYELKAAREDLQSTIEEMESSNEELKSSNEEVMSMNEELQSTNEELETSKEELQSLNEELSTVNGQLQDKVGILETTNDDLTNLLNSTSVATLFLDRDFHVRRFTPTITNLFRLIPTDIGRHLKDIALRFIDNDLLDQAQRVLTSLQPFEKVVHTDEDQHYLCQILPYRTVTDRIAGLVLSFIDITERVRNQQALAAAKRGLQHDKDILTAVMHGAKNSHLVYLDCDFNFVNLNQTYSDYCGYKRDELIGKNYFSFNASEACKNIFIRVRDTGIMYEAYDQPYTCPNKPVKGLSYWDWTLTPVINGEDQIEGLVLALHETTQRKLVEDELRLAAKVFDQSAESIMIADQNWKIIRVNKAFTTLTGYSAKEAIGSEPQFLQADSQDKTFYEAIQNGLQSEKKWQGEIWSRRKSGEVYPEWLTISAVENSNNQLVNYVAISSDISVIKESMDRVTYLATHDELTGLPNRALFLDRISRVIAQNERKPQQFAIIFLDLDNFKKVNDMRGHKVGDELLISVAEGLQNVVREHDTVSRFGGDEFVLLLMDTDRILIHKTLERISDELSSIYIEKSALYVSCSGGISIFPEDGNDAEKLINNADNAMYDAKKAGKNKFNFFSKEQQLKQVRQQSIEVKLREALKRNTLELYYQPQFDLSTNELYGVEALLRWTDAELGILSPMEFIAIAEQTQLISILGEWVCNEMCRQMAEWSKRGCQNISLSMNVSAAQFTHTDIVKMLESTIKHHQVNPEYITIELTETALMHDQLAASKTIEKLEKLGIKLSIDDFGTGYSSLSSIQKYKVHELKIDKSFIDKISSHEDSRELTQTIIAMSKVLGLTVVAEGIETKEQLELLSKMNCDIGQGFFLAKPLPANEVIKLLNIQ